MKIYLSWIRPLFLDQIEARRAKNKFLEKAPPYLRVWMTPPPPSEGLDPPLKRRYVFVVVVVLLVCLFLLFFAHLSRLK